MKLIRRFIQYMTPSVEPKVKKDIDRQSIRSIHVISLLVLLMEIMILTLFLVQHAKNFTHHNLISLISVCFCIFLCASATLISGKMLRNNDLSHKHFFVFKIIFFILFTVWAVFVDCRHYKAGDQMMTFFVVNLILICFVIFRPWLGTILIGLAYAGLYASLYSVDGAVGIEPLNYLVYMLASIACSTVRCHGQISTSTKAIRLQESNAALETTSRCDGLTGLLNRLALEEDAHKMDGRRMTAYMADINYCKEINDQNGHAAGDAILRKTSETLKRLYPGASYYRYGGDEFLVLTLRPPEENYAPDTYQFSHEKFGINVLLSIGNAQGTPASYQELFDLISLADKALYMTKQRTHSVEFGGHDRRKTRR